MTTTAHEAHEAVYERTCDCAACVKDRARTAPEDAIARLTRERDEALRTVENLRAQHTFPRVEDVNAIATLTRERDEAQAEVERLRERVSYLELGNVPRLLGIAPDQLEAVRGVLAAAERVYDATSTLRIAALNVAIGEWLAAGRPLLAAVPSPASEGEERCKCGPNEACSRCCR